MGTKEKIAMTTPVYKYTDDEARQMAFVMPAEMSYDDMPQPSSRDGRMNQIESGRWAVYRYSGNANDQKDADALEKLVNWMGESYEYDETQTPMFGYFDPPWELSWLRRNEVMLRLD